MNERKNYIVEDLYVGEEKKDSWLNAFKIDYVEKKIEQFNTQ